MMLNTYPIMLMKLELSISYTYTLSVIISQISLVILRLSCIQWQTKLALFLCFNRGRLHFIYHYNSTYTDSMPFSVYQYSKLFLSKGITSNINRRTWLIHSRICTSDMYALNLNINPVWKAYQKMTMSPKTNFYYQVHGQEPFLSSAP